MTDFRSQGTSAALLVTPYRGLLASAGGLVATMQFLARGPTSGGPTFLMVQHLEPTDKAMLLEVLQRATHKYLKPASGKADWSLYVMARVAIRTRVAAVTRASSWRGRCQPVRCPPTVAMRCATRWRKPVTGTYRSAARCS